MAGYLRAVAVAVSLAMLPGFGLAQVRPDAGRALEDAKTGGKPQPARPSPLLDADAPLRPALKAPESLRVLVREFRLTGNTGIETQELQGALAGFLNRELTLAELQRAADAVTQVYRSRGYFLARAYLPAQDIQGGIVEIAVIEARLGALEVRVAAGGRVSESRLREYLAGHQPEGSVLSRDGLERALLLIHDLPGIAAEATVGPGRAPGTSDVTLNARDTPLFSGSVDADNFGNRFTGDLRVGANLYANSPTGRGDLLAARVQVSEHSPYARLAYQLPVGANGLRLGVSLSSLRFRLCCDFAALQVKGDATDAALSGQYPIVRSREFNLHAALHLSARAYDNETIAGKTSDKTVRAADLSISGDAAHGTGASGLSVTLTGGRLDLSGLPADQQADALSRRAHGGYNKLGFALSHLRPLAADLNFYAAIRGQAASKNLDSSEKIALGGPAGVRAYPVGEATGDQGFVANLELRYALRQDWQFSGFLDYGEIRLNKNTWPGWEAGNPALPNGYALKGAGLSMRYQRPADWFASLTLAGKIGNNPGRNAQGTNADNRGDRLRAWVQVGMFF